MDTGTVQGSFGDYLTSDTVSSSTTAITHSPPTHDVEPYFVDDLYWGQFAMWNPFPTLMSSTNDSYRSSDVTHRVITEIPSP